MVKLSSLSNSLERTIGLSPQFSQLTHHLESIWQVAGCWKFKSTPSRSSPSQTEHSFNTSSSITLIFHSSRRHWLSIVALPTFPSLIDSVVVLKVLVDQASTSGLDFWGEMFLLPENAPLNLWIWEALPHFPTHERGWHGMQHNNIFLSYEQQPVNIYSSPQT